MSSTVDSRLRLARVSVIVIFFLNGFGFANWVVRIPAAQENIGAGAGGLGFALLGAACGSLLAMPTIGGLVSRFGSRPVTVVTMFLFAAMLPLPAFAGSLLGLFGALFLIGVTFGGLDVAMNAHAVTVEKGYGRAIMSSFHAFFSLGGLVGAIVGGFIASFGVGISVHLIAISLSLVFFAFFAIRHLLPAQEDAESIEDGAERSPAFARPTKGLLGLGVIAFCILVGEGAMADWSAVYLRGTLGTSEGFAAAGFAIFSLTMTIGRFSGDWITNKIGAKTIVRVSASIAAVGLAVGLIGGTPAFALLGFGCAGLGFAVVFPATLSAAGHAGDLPPGPAVAAIATAGYFGFLVGPPSIGFAAELFGLGGALFIVVALSATVVVLAGNVEKNVKKT